MNSLLLSNRCAFNSYCVHILFDQDLPEVKAVEKVRPRVGRRSRKKAASEGVAFMRSTLSDDSQTVDDTALVKKETRLKEGRSGQTTLHSINETDIIMKGGKLSSETENGRSVSFTQPPPEPKRTRNTEHRLKTLAHLSTRVCCLRFPSFSRLLAFPNFSTFVYRLCRILPHY